MRRGTSGRRWAVARAGSCSRTRPGWEARKPVARRSHPRPRRRRGDPRPGHVRGAAAAKYVDTFHQLREKWPAPLGVREVKREILTMRFGRLNPAIVVLGLVVIVSTPAMASATDPDWKAVEQALGKSGQIQPGDVFRIGMPRTDLAVTVRGVPVKAGFALGSYAAFKQVGDHAMVMGDLVLLDQEIPAVMAGLLSGGLEVTAVHNHLNEMSPHT